MHRIKIQMSWKHLGFRDVRGCDRRKGGRRICRIDYEVANVLEKNVEGHLGQAALAF